MIAKTLEIQVRTTIWSRNALTGKPILALAELIWNAVDADATQIDVTLVEDDLYGLKAISRRVPMRAGRVYWVAPNSERWRPHSG